MGNKWNSKCRFFNENYACDTLTSESLKSCDECKFSSHYDKKILIIKLGALGDVLRTTPILEEIKAKYPESLIYWLVSDSYGQGMQLLQNNPYVDKVLIYNLDSILRLQQEEFDIVFSLEIDAPGTLVANLVQSKEKYGYYFNNGCTCCFNPQAEEYLETAFLTHIKLENKKTYQQLIFRSAGFEFKNQEIIFQGIDEDYAEKFKLENNIQEKDKLIGINFSSSRRWPSKAWAKEKVIELIQKLHKNYKVVLLGGPEEAEKIPEIVQELTKKGISVLANNPKNTLREFASIVNLCSKVISTDSMTLHLATALKKPVIALFFSTPDWEIESYGTIKKIVSPMLKEKFFSMQASEELANSISAEEVLDAID